MSRCLHFAFLAVFASGSQVRASVEISNAPTQGMNCASGVCAATAKKAVLNVTDLEGMLAGGDVAVASGSLAKDIEIKTALNWASSAKLSLDAYRSVVFDKAVVVAGTGAALTITTNDGGTGGDFRFLGNGHAEIWDAGSKLMLDGKPYVLVNNLGSLAGTVNADPGGNYALARGYDAKHDGHYGSAVVSAMFSGSFEGLGNVITNLRFSQKARDPNAVGLFAAIAAGGTVRDIGIANATVVIVRSRQDMVGLLAASNSGAIAHSYASGSFQADGGESALGGLVGYNDGSISDAGASVAFFVSPGIDPADAGYAGALVGQNNGSIDGCTASGDIELGLYAGGAVGGSAGTIANCHASTTVSSLAHGAVAGGLVAIGGNVSNSSATGSVSAFGAGGLVGLEQGLISSSYATGAVSSNSGDTGVGGLVGFFYTGLIQNSYATGSVYGGAGQFSDGGGLVGRKIDYNGAGDIEDCYATNAVTSGGPAGGLIGRDDV